ncbi:hypothetical protein B7P43_G14768 [Cryptotermes secundus]|uniref:Uncharacterized protein n=1 Tax=Cryptotermes secundus TaxID=105785 RepID=A0A2J7PTU4_9NEOP|nr:hypothetical protein B7P43_G14768 [Cryptotermes secundus]
MEPEGSSPYSQENSIGPCHGPDQSHSSHPISLRSILLLSIHLRLNLRSGLFPSGFPTNILYAFLVSPKLLIMQFSPTPCHVISLRSNILLSTLFSNILSPCSSLNVRDQVSHPYRTIDKIIVFYILIFML